MPRRQGGTQITRRSRLLCPVGCGLQIVTFVDPISFTGNPAKHTRVVLECRHERGELLPVHPGCVSFEDFGTVRGERAFPVRIEE
jgi:hypothetical protein